MSPVASRPPLLEPVHVEPGQRELTLRLPRTADIAARAGGTETHTSTSCPPPASTRATRRGPPRREPAPGPMGALFTNTEDFTGTSAAGRT